MKDFAKKNPNVRLLDRTKAEMHGPTLSDIEAAMLVKTPYTVIMDGDLQHPIEKIAGIRSLLKKNDLVVAVRGKIKNRTLLRAVLSVGIIYFSYVVFTVRRKPIVRDMMSGFLGIRTAVLKSQIKKNKDGFVGSGGKILLDILRQMDKDAPIAVVPYTDFGQRRSGSSKFFGVRGMLLVLESLLKPN